MSAKSEGYIVKEFSHPEGYPVVIFLDAFQDQNHLFQYFELHRMIQAAGSISQGLIREECGHYLVWFDEAGATERCSVKAETDLYTALLKMVRIQPHNTRINGRERYEMLYGNASFIRFLTIDMAGVISRDDEVVCRLSDEEEESGISHI